MQARTPFAVRATKSTAFQTACMLVVAIAKEARVCPCKRRRYQKAPK